MDTEFTPTKWRDEHLLESDTLMTTGAVLIVLLVGWRTPLGGAVQGALTNIRTALYGSASAICAALLGFIITAVTLIVSLIQQVPRLEKFRKGKLHSQVHDVYFAAIKIMAVGTVGFLLLLFVDTDAHPFVLAEIAALLGAALIRARFCPVAS